VPGRSAEFDPLAALGTLSRHGVRFVLIGGFSAQLHGSPMLTYDIDICYARDRENLERLAAALVELGARLRGVEEEVPFRLDARTLERGDRFTFVTRAGDLDIMATPSGVGGFDDLDRNAIEMDLGTSTVRIAAIDDLIRMKRAAGRPKDLLALEELGALRDEIDARAAEERRRRRERGR
jgi:hypothetical protein